MRTWAGLMLIPWIAMTAVAWGVRFMLMTPENVQLLTTLLLAGFMALCPTFMILLWVTDLGRWLWKARNNTNYKG